MSAPLVSIITPTYNHEKYIGDCIRSAQDQTYTNWEMIIVDDGSTDNTFTIARIAQGSHFVSDVFFSATITYALILWLHFKLFPEQYCR